MLQSLKNFHVFMSTIELIQQNLHVDMCQVDHNKVVVFGRGGGGGAVIYMHDFQLF